MFGNIVWHSIDIAVVSTSNEVIVFSQMGIVVALIIIFRGKNHYEAGSDVGAGLRGRGSAFGRQRPPTSPSNRRDSRMHSLV